MNEVIGIETLSCGVKTNEKKKLTAQDLINEIKRLNEINKSLNDKLNS